MMTLRESMMVVLKHEGESGFYLNNDTAKTERIIYSFCIHFTVNL